MDFRELVATVGDEPVFETGLLLAGRNGPDAVRRQLSRWTRSGRTIQLRRGLYALAPPWQRRRPHPFLIANRIAPGSYVSGLSALAFAHAIPEYVPETTSVGPGRPHIRESPCGRFSFRHLKPRLRFGYRAVALGDDQQAFVATPEKALLDLVHLHPGGDQCAYLAELRLDYDALRLPTLADFAARPRRRCGQAGRDCGWRRRTRHLRGMLAWAVCSATGWLDFPRTAPNSAMSQVCDEHEACGRLHPPNAPLPCALGSGRLIALVFRLGGWRQRLILVCFGLAVRSAVALDHVGEDVEGGPAPGLLRGRFARIVFARRASHGRAPARCATVWGGGGGILRICHFS